MRWPSSSVSTRPVSSAATTARTWSRASTSRRRRKALEERLAEIFAEIDEAIANGKNFIVLSDRESNHTWGPIPSLLLTSAVQHHLLRRHTRTQISVAVEAGDVREIHHVALLIAYGAPA